MDFFLLVVFVLPAYFANALPVVLGGGTPIDLGKTLSDGTRLLGDGKTIRGFIGGVLGGTLAALIISVLFILPGFTFQTQIICGFLLSLGTMTGDSAGSFIKRRMKISRGKSFLLDQIFFLAFALIFAFPFTPSYVFELLPLIFLFALTYLLHIITNIIANRAGLKSVPW
ncbi:CDP-2,3-bis-(O-geranylgeranyl)-sn-glycerol synthase [Candidatus Micrarchaeota archaeon]|nr:CDP-2,3-bis-(O-geranylgeranyl)-sn-glycerol synthase [Candidatus Micrarchaeota archaeon]